MFNINKSVYKRVIHALMMVVINTVMQSPQETCFLEKIFLWRHLGEHEVCILDLLPLYYPHRYTAVIHKTS